MTAPQSRKCSLQLDSLMGPSHPPSRGLMSYLFLARKILVDWISTPVIFDTAC
jgi:hypothetical protein